MAEISSTSGFILAGGQSRRMGRDKATLEWGQTSLLEHMAQLLSTVAGPVRIVGRGDLPDRVSGKGPLGGILTALETSETEKNLIVAVDLPLLTPDFLRMFQARLLASPKALLACRIERSYPLCLGIRRSLLPVVSQRIAHGELAVQDFIEAIEGEAAEILATGFDPSIFANINTPEDWARLPYSP